MILPVIRKQLNNPVVNFIECQLFLTALLDRQSDERDVGIWRLRCVEIVPSLSENEIKGLRRVNSQMSKARFFIRFLG